jgi:hypothetical protein
VCLHAVAVFELVICVLYPFVGVHARLVCIHMSILSLPRHVQSLAFICLHLHVACALVESEWFRICSSKWARLLPRWFECNPKRYSESYHGGLHHAATLCVRFLDTILDHFGAAWGAIWLTLGTISSACQPVSRHS